MARQLRIEFQGAFYHVTSRGNQKQPIFLDDRDRSTFLNYMKEAHEKYSAFFHAFCLMGNHFHLLLETPHENLSKIMHFINTSYTLFFNKKHSRVGHLLQGRFKAILIEKEFYALELSRYIHLNPVRATLVRFPDEYPWSSYQQYIGRKTPPPWLMTNLILGYFAPDLNLARKLYAAFVIEAVGKQIGNPLQNSMSSLILGREEFVKRIQRDFISNKKDDPDVPAVRKFRGRPALKAIHVSVERVLGTKNKFVRNVAIFISRKRTDYTLNEIAEFYQLRRSAVGKIFQQMKEDLASNKIPEDAISEIEKSLF